MMDFSYHEQKYVMIYEILALPQHHTHGVGVGQIVFLRSVSAIPYWYEFKLS